MSPMQSPGTSDPVLVALGRTAAHGTRAAVTAAVSFGLLAGLTGAAVAALLTQAKSTTRAIQLAALESAVVDGLIPDPAGINPEALPVPAADGIYLPDGNLQPADLAPEGYRHRRPITIAMLGDSTAVGYGTRTTDDLPGVRLARGIAAETGRPVRLRTHGLVGCGAADLERQVGEAVAGAPDVVVIVIGANDIKDKVPPSRSADLLGESVKSLTAQHIPVVVGTCPDFGVIAPIPQPLRSVLHTWSRLLATLQERAVLANGGRAVAIGRIVSPEFAGHPEMFAADHFHPSGAGYARAVLALLPVVLEELRRSEAANSSGAA